MIIPSIDLMGGSTVQLVGGVTKKLDAGDPRPLAQKFALVGEIAVIDLDAALGRGDHRALIEELVRIAPCRVGGGIRDVGAAQRWLAAGAAKVILGTAAKPEILRELPRACVIAALDAVDGEIVVEGWRKKTGQRVEERIDELKDLVGGFLLTFVEREGRMVGMDHERVRMLVQRAAPARVTVAGGIATAAEVAAVDALGADAQVGMALYTGALDLAGVLVAMLKSDRPDGLWPTVVCDEGGEALGLVYSNAESLAESLRTGRGVYHSRKRGLWRKGESSGAHQELRRVELDCDRDALRFLVKQHGSGFCHLNTWTCFGDDQGLRAFLRRVAAGVAASDLADPQRRGKALLDAAQQLADARTAEDSARAAAVLLRGAFAALHQGGADLAAVEAALARNEAKR